MKRFYFVCWCGAKWFHVERTAICPRCRVEARSHEQLPVPWLQEEEMVTIKLSDKPCLFCAAKEDTVVVKSKENDSQLVACPKHMIGLLKKWEGQDAPKSPASS